MNGPSEEQKGGMAVWDTGGLVVVLTSNLLADERSQSFLVDETPQRGSMTIYFLVEDLSLGR